MCACCLRLWWVDSTRLVRRRNGGIVSKGFEDFDGDWYWGCLRMDGGAADSLCLVLCSTRTMVPREVAAARGLEQRWLEPKGKAGKSIWYRF